MATLTILVVDDETDVKHLFSILFRRQIRKQQYQFLFASSGEEALVLLDQETEIDLILSDIDMPGMSGLELLERMQELSLNIPTIMVSAHRSQEYISAAMDAGACNYLSKPFVAQDLKDVIQQATQGSHQVATARTAKQYLRRSQQRISESDSEELETVETNEPQRRSSSLSLKKIRRRLSIQSGQSISGHQFLGA